MAIRFAIEVRGHSWLYDDVFDVLRRHNAALCLHDLLESHLVRTHRRLDVCAIQGGLLPGSSG